MYSKANTTVTNILHSPEEPHDYLLRVSKEITSSLWNIQVTEIDNLRQWKQTKDEEVSILQQLVKWQHKIIDYNSHYCAFLLGQVNEDEFEVIAETFSYEIKDVSPEILTSIIEKIYKLTEIEFTPSDLAGLFECKTENIVQALKPLAITNKNLNKMLPIAN